MVRIRKNRRASSNESNFVRQGFCDVLCHSVQSNDSSFFNLPESFTKYQKQCLTSIFPVSVSKAVILQLALKSKLGKINQSLIMNCQDGPCGGLTEIYQASPEPGSHLKLRLNDLSLSPLSLKACLCHRAETTVTSPQQTQQAPYIKYLLGLGPGGIWGKARRSTHSSPILPSETLPLDSLKPPQKGGSIHKWFCGMDMRWTVPLIWLLCPFLIRRSVSMLTKQELSKCLGHFNFLSS